ncbi:mannitol-1-phosphate 5-dehydrogenase [compost metagenome]
MAAACIFQNDEDPEVAELQAAIQNEGIGAAITRYTGIAADHPLHQQIVAEYEQLKRSN